MCEKLQSKKVAIVLPVYNVEPFLSECLHSILSQTHTNFTIFAVDDASTDKSTEILEQYKFHDNRIIILKHKTNRGLSATRNTALDEIEKIGSYDYISFCDSDDVVSQNMISELLSAVVENNADIATCCFKRFPSDKKNISRFENFCSFTPESFVEQIFSIGRWKKTSGNGGYVWLRLFNAQKIKGLRFQNEKTLSEDELFFFVSAAKVSKITYIPTALYFYRTRINSLSKDKEFHRKLLRSRIAGLDFSQKISRYALIVNACAILHKSKQNNDLLCKQLLLNTTPLLREGKKLGLISKTKYWSFIIKNLTKLF